MIFIRQKPLNLNLNSGINSTLISFHSHYENYCNVIYDLLNNLIMVQMLAIFFKIVIRFLINCNSLNQETPNRPNRLGQTFQSTNWRLLTVVSRDENLKIYPAPIQLCYLVQIGALAFCHWLR